MIWSECSTYRNHTISEYQKNNANPWEIILIDCEVHADLIDAIKNPTDMLLLCSKFDKLIFTLLKAMQKKYFEKLQKFFVDTTTVKII